MKQLGIESWHDMRAGICHQIMGEKGHIIPGELILGTDSHSTTYGAFGAAGSGIGVPEMAYVLATGELWMRVPSTIKFIIQGELPERVTSKDIIFRNEGEPVMLTKIGKFCINMASNITSIDNPHL